jgi:hypothetical protein
MAMRSITLEHNDDCVLDPGDPGLVTRGSLLIDGHVAGMWEQRRDGSWIARLRGSGRVVTAAGRSQLIERLASDASL